MSQLDLIAELRARPPVAPAELRERVRRLAADAPAPRRRFTWRRALVVAIAVAGLAAVAGVLGTRDVAQRSAAGDRDASPQTVLAGRRAEAATASAPDRAVGAADAAARAPAAPRRFASRQRSRRRARPTPSATRPRSRCG